MHLDMQTTFYVVTDPTPESTVTELIHRTSMTGFLGLVQGDQITEEDNPAIHDSAVAAEVDAQARFFAMRLRRAIQTGAQPETLRDATRVEFRDGDGNLLFATAVE
jgi:hypothetical protein